MPQALLRKYARYNVWANKTLLEGLSLLPEKEYHGHAGLCFRSIHGTLNHVHLADKLWFARLTQTPLDPAVLTYWQKTADETFAKPGDTSLYWETYVPERLALAHALVVQADAFAAYVDRASITDDATVTYLDSSGKEYKRNLSELLLHVVNHGAHHRGQVTAAMYKFGLPPPSIDVLYFKP
ncbi:Aste57867_10415 [Aphanomyces stellatus]|uniref:Aste57867_10415 protein n=1 Tax=Aphanomyces stellatus TaxID=120398 RepID=A0A485KQA1_9STRA|nr:hypothetical protein As57867_010375 [Aphanomyces stellatus]VFT87289.1 Aste57867_10415 [Aphanomyces stellatus]